MQKTQLAIWDDSEKRPVKRPPAARSYPCCTSLTASRSTGIADAPAVIIAEMLVRYIDSWPELWTKTDRKKFVPWKLLLDSMAGRVLR
jgi:hypothetical protein